MARASRTEGEKCVGGSDRACAARPAVDAWMKMWSQLGYGIAVYNMLSKRLVDINASALELYGQSAGVREMDVDRFCAYCSEKGLSPKEIVYEHYMAFVFIPDSLQKEQRSNVSLSKRENEVFECIVLGKTADEMATILGISKRTVEKHCENICRKFGVRGRKELLHVYGMTANCSV